MNSSYESVITLFMNMNDFDLGKLLFIPKALNAKFKS